MVAAWARAFDEIATDLDDAITAMMTAAETGMPGVSSIVRARQARRALRIAASQLQAVAAASGVRVSRDLARVLRLAIDGDIALIEGQLPPTLRGTVLRTDARQLEQIVRRSTQQITARHYLLSQDATLAMRRELARTVAVGDNPRTAARRMFSRVQGEFNGGLTRALVIARTENLDAYRNAGMASQNTNRDVLAGWEWIAALSARTCRSCIAMHGSIHDLDEPGPDDHQQGRCTRTPVTKSWADLGFHDIPEPKSAVPDAEDWFGGLSEAEQRRMLTNRGYDEWQAGRYPRSAWSDVRRTPGWRSSRTPSTPPASEALAS